mmetsp:Transcript_30995/g.95732  ORF Transcript_30995/g.95732 Transcript_30995/m.95732 type:complete len:240 (-) Transcript_30995:110-829(-)
MLMNRASIGEHVRVLLEARLEVLVDGTAHPQQVVAVVSVDHVVLGDLDGLGEVMRALHLIPRLQKHLGSLGEPVHAERDQTGRLDEDLVQRGGAHPRRDLPDVNVRAFAHGDALRWCRPVLPNRVRHAVLRRRRLARLELLDPHARDVVQPDERLPLAGFRKRHAGGPSRIRHHREGVEVNQPQFAVAGAKIDERESVGVSPQFMRQQLVVWRSGALLLASFGALRLVNLREARGVAEV